MTIEKARLNTIFKNKAGDSFTIVEYFNSNNVSVKFEDGTVIKNREYKECKLGSIKNPMKPLILGVGYFGVGDYLSRDIITKQKTPYYRLWMNILQRCYNKKNHIKRPTYKGVSVCEEWHNFQSFAKWYEENWKPFMDEHWNLDKDLLGDSKIYSPKNCCFLPKTINNYLIKTYGKMLPQGVRITSANNYQVRVCFKGVTKYLGAYKTVDEAVNVYNIEKEYNLRQLSNEWKPFLDDKIYKALMNYKIEITD